MIRQIPVFLKSILLGSSIIIGLGIFFSATPALAISISTAIPGMSNVSSSTPPGAYIGAFYNFALMISGILALGAIVYGGVLYAMSAGNSSKQSEGRAWITSALTGLLLLGGAYLILYTINPNLVELGLPTLQQINLPTSTYVSGWGNSGSCQAPVSGACSTAMLQSSCFGASAQAAGGICNTESSNNPNAEGDDCGGGNYASIGLFQINLSANTIQDPKTGQTLNCPSAFSNPYTGSNPHCTIVNQNLYNECVAAAKNPSTNIQEACALSKQGTNWSLWGPRTRQVCGV